MADKKKEIFADGIGQIHFAGGMVRFDFVTLQPAEDGKAPEGVAVADEPCEQVALPEEQDREEDEAGSELADAGEQDRVDLGGGEQVLDAGA